MAAIIMIKIKALAITNLRRRPGSPDLPTVNETILPRYEAGEWVRVAKETRMTPD